MQNKRQLNADIDLTKAVKSLAQAYEEISVMHIRKVREKVVKSREFSEQLGIVFGDVRDSYKKQIADLLLKNKKNRLGDLSLLNKNGKSAAVFISANTPLYGDIIPEVFDKFLEYVKNNKADVTIVGRFGKQLFENAGVGKKCDFFELPDISIQFNNLRGLLLHLIAYQKVDVFYGQFENTMMQVPKSANVSGQDFFETESVNRETHKIVFEPNLEDIFRFFEAQVFNNIFLQIIQEAELSRHGSRIKAMESSIVKIEKDEKLLSQKMVSLKKMLDNKNRLERLAGMSLWR